MLGVVVIGRNEGDRLARCLKSIGPLSMRTVYVDSGSTDGSVLLARSLHVEVVELDCSQPFSAARARNEGFSRLLDLAPQLDYVQFIDGDCELFERWLYHASEALSRRVDVAAVAGRLYETRPQDSVYNRLCDIEWNTPPGETDAIGGISMMRTQAFRQAGGFDPTIIAGEEPELCVRLRLDGWTILRLAEPMALHDAAMTRFSQWWRRAVRSGHAYAEGCWRHGRGPLRHWRREVRSITVWGAILPLLTAATGLLVTPVALVLLAGYLLLASRIYSHSRRRGLARHDSLIYALFCSLAKFPQALGMGIFHARRLKGRTRTIIEYK